MRGKVKMIKKLPIGQIKRDKKIQQRLNGIIPARVREYAKAMSEGNQFPPVIVYYDGKTYWLADGFHRCEAAEQISRREIEAEVKDGDRRDAILFAAGSNAEHGIRRTNDDKRKAVVTLLMDKEWKKWSDHAIARKTRCTQPFVSKLRRQMANGGSPLRKGADGRLINTQNIGRRQITQAWKKATAREKKSWVRENKEEIKRYLDDL